MINRSRKAIPQGLILVFTRPIPDGLKTPFSPGTDKFSAEEPTRFIWMF